MVVEETSHSGTTFLVKLPRAAHLLTAAMQPVNS